MADQNISNNPFAALFPTVAQAQDFSATFKPTITSQTSDATIETSPVSPADETDDQYTINTIFENIFLITLDSDPGENSRPARCVYLHELHESLKQTNLDRENVEQVVFERLMMENPGASVVSTRQGARPSPKEASSAGESEHLRYLYQSYRRCEQQKLNYGGKYTDLLTLSEQIILNNARMCLQHPDFFTNLDPCQQFMDIFNDDEDDMFPFFERVSTEVYANSDEGNVLDAFKPVLDKVKERLATEFSLGHSGIFKIANLLMFFTRTQPLAEAFLAHISPANPQNGVHYEKTVLGHILSISCIVKNPVGQSEFFDRPSRFSKQEHEITESSIHGPTNMLNEAVYQIIYNILKLGGQPRNIMLSWIGNCIHANIGRAKMWSNQVPGIFNALHASDGFFVNLSAVMLKLCKPFSQPRSPKLLKIQYTYCPATKGHNAELQDRNVHTKGLHDQTTLVPPPEDNAEEITLENSYNFITECFFMTHQCIHLGLHVVNEKFIKLNQELHRIQGIFQDIVRQGGQDSDTGVQIKERMDKGMTVFLCMKAALTEPRLLDLCFDFSLATATYLSHVGTASDLRHYADVTFPLPQNTPTCLTCLPELLVENVVDFMLFVRRFKDHLYEEQGERLNDLMTFILVYMGSPNRVRNPHLRARLAEALDAIMPHRENANTGMVSNYHRERLFIEHPLCKYVGETLLSVFVSIEMTGQGVEFEQKFNYRRPMYAILEYIMDIELHSQAIQDLAVYAEEHIEDTKPPLFLHFINLLINDAIFLLDEALSYMSQIKEKQSEQDSGAWTELPPTQRQENENNLRHLGMLARFHNIMGNSTIRQLEILTHKIRSIFTHNVMVDRIAAMLNYFLLHLVGPKKKNLKVKDLDEFDFKPQDLVSSICQIYLNLGSDDHFCMAVARDGRSYSHDLFIQAESVLQRIHTAPNTILEFSELALKIKVRAARHSAEEEAMENAPEEFLDPIMGTLMRDPVLLPASGQVVDRATIARHILSDQSDPFNRAPLTMEDVKPVADLKNKIDSWLSSIHNPDKTDAQS